MSETAAARLSRLLALVPWLMGHDGVTLGECAAHFGVSELQLQEDLELLIVCGRPGYGPDQLVDIQFWDDDFEIRLDEQIHVIDPQALAQPLRLSHEEALTLLVALRMLAQVPGVVGRDAIVSAAVKLEVASQSSDTAREIAIRTDVDDAVRAAVDGALAENRQLAIRYASGTHDEVTERIVVPARIVTVDGISYLEAYCHQAQAIRTFRLDRVLEASVGPAEGPQPESADGDSVDAPVIVAVLDLEPGARWVVDTHRATPRGPGADGTLRVELPVLTVEWGARLVMSLRGQARAVSPADLVHAVARGARSALGSYP